MSFRSQRHEREIEQAVNAPLLEAPRVAGPRPPALRPGGDWVVVRDLHVPGSPGVSTAAVGERGCIVFGIIADPAPVRLVNGRPYCGEASLEPAIAGLLKARRSVAEALRGPLKGKPRPGGTGGARR